MKEIDITGKKFNRLTALDFSRKSNSIYYWNFQCDCGAIKEIRKSSVINESTKSCGCLTSERKWKHGRCGSREYNTWVSMKQRCFDKKTAAYKNYGGRGITVCRRWLKFENFFEDMGERPAGKSLDRIDNNGNYEPGNCRWATDKEQSYNRRNTIKINIDGKTLNIEELSTIIGMSPRLIYSRLWNNIPLSRSRSKKTIVDTSCFTFSGDRKRDMQSLRDMGVTLRQIGEIYGLTRERIRQLLKK